VYIIGKDCRMTIDPADPIPVDDAMVSMADTSDAAEILVLQRCCWVDEARS
jgi:hypothetical protein